jgi:hypothetical protein
MYDHTVRLFIPFTSIRPGKPDMREPRYAQSSGNISLDFSFVTMKLLSLVGETWLRAIHYLRSAKIAMCLSVSVAYAYAASCGTVRSIDRFVDIL